MSKDLSPWRSYLLLGIITAAFALAAGFQLGSVKVPQTWYIPQAAGESFTLDLGGLRRPDRLYLYTGIGDGRYRIESSRDGQAWEALVEAKRNVAFIWSWSVIALPPELDGRHRELRYLRWTVEEPREYLFEIAVTEPVPEASGEPLGPDGRPWPGQAIPGLRVLGGDPRLDRLVDEPERFSYYPDPTVNMVFDEVYHARTAWEHLNRLEPYEYTHPPLGKVIIMGGIALFGMDPLGWRILPYVFGVLMLPLCFAVARRFFGKPEPALAATLLLALDCMHFTQSRIGTVDVFMVSFLLAGIGAFWRWFQDQAAGGDRPEWRRQLWLVLAGLCVGLAAATKWNALYAGLALAGFFVAAVVLRLRRQGGGWWLGASLGAGLLGFVVIPALVYYLAYIPFFLVPGHAGGLQEVLDNQVRMWNYHSTLNTPHDYASPWWQWPFVVKPVWYFTARETMPEGLTSTISTMGNPLIWWLSLPAALYALWRGIRRRDGALLFLASLYLALYLPWIVAPRKVTFIYHYFPMTPVVILMIAGAFHRLWEDDRRAGLSGKGLVRVQAAYLVLTGLAFALFFPVISGMVMSKTLWTTHFYWFAW